MSFWGRDGRGVRDQRDQGTEAGLWRPFHALVRVPRGRSAHSRGFCVPKCWRPRPWGGKGDGPPGPPGNGDSVGTPQLCWRSQFYQCPLHPPPPPASASCNPVIVPRICRDPQPCQWPPRSSQRLAGLTGPLHPFKTPPILLGSLVMSVPGLLGFPNLSSSPVLPWFSQPCKVPRAC